MIRSIKALYHLCIAVLAAFWFKFPSQKLIVIGVTGTDGKTTTATLIYEILKASGLKTSMITSIHAMIGGTMYNTGFHVTTPDAFWVQKYLREAVDHGDTHMVLEVTSHALAQHRVFGVRFAVGVLTNVTHEHLDWHKTFRHYLASKLSLLRQSDIAIINRDEAEIYNHVIPKLNKHKIITYGIRREAMITPKNFHFTTTLPGLFNKYNCLAAIATGYALGLKKKRMLEVIAAFGGVAGRMEVVASTPYTVIIDFAHTPNAIEQVLKTIKVMTKKRIIHVFGSAGLRDSTKRPMMGRASARYADIIVLTEEDFRTEDVEDIMDQIARGIPMGKSVYRYRSRSEAIDFALKEAKPGDFVIITGKGHEKSLCRGITEYPWSDQEEVKKVMKRILKS